jgi:hypothetical protein
MEQSGIEWSINYISLFGHFMERFIPSHTPQIGGEEK